MEEPFGLPETPMAEEPHIEKTGAKPRKRKLKKKKTSKPKLQKFDVVLLQLLKEGVSSLEELQRIFNVHEREFLKRLQTLMRRKLIVMDEEKKGLKLSIAGVNAYQPRWKEAADAWLERKAMAWVPDVEEETTSIPVEETPPKLEPEKTNEIIEFPEEPPKEKKTELDLTELMEKYGPNEAQRIRNSKQSPFLERHVKKRAEKNERPRIELKRPEPVVQQTVFSQKNIRMDHEKRESCELCKGTFVTSVNSAKNRPKYGHCFCGAAYHKDCFEAIVQGDKHCINCGRKLALALDMKAEEAVKDLEDLSAT
ncbi:hypothetical protein KJ765_03920 [Candidatus Micrarchaeota archaeon]|nr:hypothetical protein [Candidatus Micrarchaeota archaeon]